MSQSTLFCVLLASLIQFSLLSVVASASELLLRMWDSSISSGVLRCPLTDSNLVSTKVTMPACSFTSLLLLCLGGNINASANRINMNYPTSAMRR